MTVIRLLGRVYDVSSSAPYLDGLQRVAIRPRSRDEYWCLTNVKNTAGLRLDQEVEVEVRLAAAGATEARVEPEQEKNNFAQGVDRR